MPLDKYLFNPDDTLPAENVDSIDPDDISPQAAGFLTGGTSITLSNFITLGNGSDNGAFKINIDGTDYDNIAVPVYEKMSDVNNAGTSETENISIGDTSVNSFTGYEYSSYQTFTVPANVFIKKIKAYIGGANGTEFKICAANSDDTLESTSALATGNLNGGAGEKTVTLSNLVYSGKTSRKFAIVFRGVLGSAVYIKANNARVYMDGRYYRAGSFENRDAYLKVYSVPLDKDLFCAAIDDVIQSAIRTATSGLETVVYSTNKFIITSATKNRASQVLKLMAPTSGTDISEYLDLGANATETQGTGSEYYLPRLDENGRLDSFISTETITTGNLTVPTGCNKIILEVKVRVDNTENSYAELFLSKNGKTTAHFAGATAASSEERGLTFTWTGDAIVLSSFEEGLPSSFEVKAYYYRY